MKPLTANVLIETGQRGSNHGLVTTSDGLVLIDGPHKPSDTLRLKAEIERRGAFVSGSSAPTWRLTSPGSGRSDRATTPSA
jgi:hypothetical protein